MRKQEFLVPVILLLRACGSAYEVMAEQQMEGRVNSTTAATGSNSIQLPLSPMKKYFTKLYREMNLIHFYGQELSCYCKMQEDLASIPQTKLYPTWGRDSVISLANP